MKKIITQSQQTKTTQKRTKCKERKFIRKNIENNLNDKNKKNMLEYIIISEIFHIYPGFI